jgi:hypothetical protein
MILISLHLKGEKKYEKAKEMRKEIREGERNTRRRKNDGEAEEPRKVRIKEHGYRLRLDIEKRTGRKKYGAKNTDID